MHTLSTLTVKAPIRTPADDKIPHLFLILENKWYNINPYLLFLRNRQNLNCRLLQITGGALRVNVRRQLEANWENPHTTIQPLLNCVMFDQRLANSQTNLRWKLKLICMIWSDSNYQKGKKKLSVENISNEIACLSGKL